MVNIEHCLDAIFSGGRRRECGGEDKIVGVYINRFAGLEMEYFFGGDIHACRRHHVYVYGGGIGSGRGDEKQQTPRDSPGCWILE
jgi:hypothetical protein